MLETARPPAAASPPRGDGPGDHHAGGGRPLVDALLHEYGELTRQGLLDYLPQREPQAYLYEPLRDYPSRGGKMMRPSLCLAATEALGGRRDDALRTAMAIELLHNALLIHDDIQDWSDERRGLPTMHKLQGVPLAINVGDMLTLMSLRPLFENHRLLGSRIAMRIIEDTERMTRESAEGQALELGWRRDNVVDLRVEDYLIMVLKKTCWLATIFPLRAGATIATRGRLDVEPLIRFGFFLGAAFQIRDDILNLVGDPASYGKEIGGDLYEGKRTLMILHLLERVRGSERERLVEFLGLRRDQRTAGDVGWVRAAMERQGSIAYANEIAHGLAGAARREFDLVFGPLPESRGKSFLAEMPAWMLERC